MLRWRVAFAGVVDTRASLAVNPLAATKVW